MPTLPISFDSDNNLCVLLAKKKGVWSMLGDQKNASVQHLSSILEDETFGVWFNSDGFKKLLKSKKIIKKYYDKDITIILFDMKVQTVEPLNNIIKFLQTKYQIVPEIEEYKWVNIYETGDELLMIKNDTIEIINIAYRQLTIPVLRMLAKSSKCKISKLKNKEDITQVLIQRFKEKDSK